MILDSRKSVNSIVVRHSHAETHVFMCGFKESIATAFPVCTAVAT